MDCGGLGGGRRHLGMVSPALLQTNLGAGGLLCSCRAECDELGLTLSCYRVEQILGEHSSKKSKCRVYVNKRGEVE